MMAILIVLSTLFCILLIGLIIGFLFAFALIGAFPQYFARLFSGIPKASQDWFLNEFLEAMAEVDEVS